MRSGAHERIRSIQSGEFTESGVCTGISYFVARFATDLNQISSSGLSWWVMTARMYSSFWIRASRHS